MSGQWETGPVSRQPGADRAEQPGERELTAVLHRIADQARPARLAPDTWRRGRRRRRAAVSAAVAAVVLALAGVPLLVSRAHPGPAPAAGGAPVVPARVYPPLTGEDTIGEDPPGPAAIVVSGDRELRGSDIWGWEGRSLLVARDGGYRLVRTVGETTAGVGDLLLSPDGRRLAAQQWLEGATRPDDPGGETAVADLSTGRIRRYAGGVPVAWAPDGRSLLVWDVSVADPRRGRLGLLDVDSGALRWLPDIKERFRLGNLAAFAPDGVRLAVATTEAVHLVDIARGTVRRLAPLTPAERLAGPGAWSPDGTRIAVWTLGDCLDGQTCGEDRLARRSFTLGWRDAATGAPVPGSTLPRAHGLAARLLGWQRDGAAVVAEYQPEDGLTMRPDDPYWSETNWAAVGGVTLTAFRPDGSRHRLVDLPGGALFVDVPADLMDSFGGRSRPWPEGMVRRLLAVWWPLGQFLLVPAAFVALVAGRRLAARRRRHTP